MSQLGKFLCLYCFCKSVAVYYWQKPVLVPLLNKKEISMIKVEHSIVINRTVPEVFAFVTDPANNTKWQDGLVESRMASSGMMGVGAQVTDVRKFLGRDMESNLEVTVFEPTKRFVQKVISGPSRLRLSRHLIPL
jgi:hypothetical protein